MKSLKLRVKISLILGVKVIALALLWFISFSHPPQVNLAQQILGHSVNQSSP